MSAPESRRTRRAGLWAAVCAVPVAVGAAVLVPISAGAAVDLPDKTPEELLRYVADSEVDALSGTIEQSSALGLPDIEGLLDDASQDAEGDGRAADAADLLSLATGTYTANVFVDGERARLQVLDQLAERNVYVDGDAREMWLVDSETQTATHVLFPDEAELEALREAQGAPEQPAPDAVPLTPDEMLDEALANLDESTEVTVGSDAVIAGREVYELVLAPRADDTLVGEMRFAVDGENGAALAASITARGADAPAFRVGFTDVSFEAPDAGALTFTPSEAIDVVERDLAAPTAEDIAEWQAKADAAPAAPEPLVSGEGWSRVYEFPASGADPFASLDPEQRGLLDAVTTAVDGGRVFQTALVTVLLTDDGRVLVGAVPAERLVEAARTGS